MQSTVSEPDQELQSLPHVTQPLGGARLRNLSPANLVLSGSQSTPVIRASAPAGYRVVGRAVAIENCDLWYGAGMTVKLNEQLRARLQRLVDAGQLSSIDEGVNLAVADLVRLAEDDMEWARPYIEAGRRDVAAGRVVDGEDVIAWLRGQAKS